MEKFSVLMEVFFLPQFCLHLVLELKYLTNHCLTQTDLWLAAILQAQKEVRGGTPPGIMSVLHNAFSTTKGLQGGSCKFLICTLKTQFWWSRHLCSDGVMFDSGHITILLVSGTKVVVVSLMSKILFGIRA
jgi:hypothetical protein